VASNSRIAVIDDDEPVRRALGRLLKSVGMYAELFSSAEEFLRSGRLRDMGCLILDVMMPGMSGVELQEHLIASDTQVPVIFISAHGDEATRARALERGAVDFLRKPFTDEALLDAIARATTCEVSG
jgi:FixJ family two-component response regulator